LSRESSLHSHSAQHSHELLTSTLVEEATPRWVFVNDLPADFGFSLIGGNTCGIFVDDVKPNSGAAGPNGLQCGDKLLKVNGTSFERLTMEQVR
jgi:hypothetical protein